MLLLLRLLRLTQPTKQTTTLLLRRLRLLLLTEQAASTSSKGFLPEQAPSSSLLLLLLGLLSLPQTSEKTTPGWLLLGRGLAEQSAGWLLSLRVCGAAEETSSRRLLSLRRTSEQSARGVLLRSVRRRGISEETATSTEGTGLICGVVGLSKEAAARRRGRSLTEKRHCELRCA